MLNTDDYKVISKAIQIGVKNNLNFVSFSDGDKKMVVGKDTVYDFGMRGKWDKDYLPQRYGKYDFLRHSKIMEDGHFLGLALPSKLADSKYFNGIICIDMDGRESDGKNVWGPVIKRLKELCVWGEDNIETKGESYHCWVKISPEWQEDIVKGDAMRASAKLRVTNESSIDFIFGGKAVRTCGIGKGYISDNPYNKMINFENLPYLSKKDTLEFLQDDDLFFERLVEKKHKTFGSSEIPIFECDEFTDEEILEFTLTKARIKQLRQFNSYSEFLTIVPHLALASTMAQRCLFESFKEMFKRTPKAQDTGLWRSYSGLYGQEEFTDNLIEALTERFENLDTQKFLDNNMNF